MKKSLFLASLIAACSLPLAHAETDFEVKIDHDGILQGSTDLRNGTWISTQVDISSANASDYLGGGTFQDDASTCLSIGTSTGAGTVNITGDGPGLSHWSLKHPMPCS